MLMVGLFATMAVLQAGSIHTGERALQNLRFWGSIAASSFIASILFGFYAIRSRKTVPQE
jgi:hypothetical protein